MANTPTGVKLTIMLVIRIRAREAVFRACSSVSLFCMPIRAIPAMMENSTSFSIP